MTLPELAERSLRLLGQIIDQAHEGIPNKLDFASPPEFIYLHARNIRALGKDVLALKAQTQSRGSRILVRSMSESLFALVAAAKDPEFPAGKVIAEQKDQIRRIKMWLGEKPPGEFQEKIEEAKREIRDIEQRCPQQKGWQVGSSRRYPPQASGYDNNATASIRKRFPLPFAQLPRLWQQHPSRLLCLELP